MANPISFASGLLSTIALFSVHTAAEFYRMGLELARVAGLPVSSWQVGDPTRTMYKFLAVVLAELDSTVGVYIKSGFLSQATGDWLTVLAWEVYGVARVEATPATSTLTATNGGGGVYPIAAGDLTFKSSISGATFRNVNPVSGTLILGPGVSYTFELLADEAGSDGSTGVGEIDTLVSTRLGVTLGTSTAGVGVDAQSDAALREQSRATTGALSPNGPADAYEYVARNADLTGVTDVQRALTLGDNTTGEVTLFIASASGPVAAATVTAVQAAVEVWATPWCIQPTVLNASATAVTVTGTINAVDLPTGWEDTIEAALATLFSDVPIGGVVSVSSMTTAIHIALGLVARDSVVITLPAANLTLPVGAVPVLTSATLTEI